MRRLLIVLAACTALTLFAERVEVKTSSSSCSVETLGARVISLRLGDQELLWNDKPVQLTDPLWAHGGIPVAWPWFGRLKPDVDRDIHGTAWKREFTVVSKEESAEKSRLVLALKGEKADLEYAIELGRAAKLTLLTRNKSTEVFNLSMAFHPYFAVGERDCVTVEGATKEPLRFSKALDDVFEADATEQATYRIVDAVLGRTISIEGVGVSGVNLWNPGPEKKCPGTIPGDEWRRFVCVEPMLRGDGKFVALAPGECRTFAMTISVKKTKE